MKAKLANLGRLGSKHKGKKRARCVAQQYSMCLETINEELGV